MIFFRLIIFVCLFFLLFAACVVLISNAWEEYPGKPRTLTLFRISVQTLLVVTVKPALRSLSSRALCAAGGEGWGEGEKGCGGG